MSHDISSVGPPTRFGDDSFDWVQSLPHGAVSVRKQDRGLVLRASEKLQQRFEDLLQRQKRGTLTAEENEQYKAFVSWTTC